MARIGFFGATGTVTGSRFLLEAEGVKALVDCGFFQGDRETREMSWESFGFDPRSIDFVTLTHAHLDHCGLLPRLVTQGFRGPVYAPEATAAILPVMLYDSVHILEFEYEWRKRRLARKGREVLPPLYERRDVDAALELLSPLPMGSRMEPAPGFGLTFRNAGHIFGAAHVEIDLKEGRRIVFSGDVGQSGKPLCPDPHRFSEADAIVVESTYGDRLHKGMEATVQEFEDAVLGAARRGGKVVIPCFALGRTQEILYYLNALVESGRLKNMPVFVDSPMATALTEIIHAHPEMFREEAQRLLAGGDDPLAFRGLAFVRDTEESKRLNEMRGPAVIISANGMCTAGRILHHLKHNLWRPEASIIFVGFQAGGTLGRDLVEGARLVKVMNEEVAVRARVHTIGGFSAHADRDELLQWLGSFREGRRKVFVVHGEPEVASGFAEIVRERLSLDVTVPSRRQTVTV